MLLTKAAVAKNPKSSPWTFWTNYLNPVAEISHAGFEVFNINFCALCVSLFSFLGRSTVKAEEPFRGAGLNFADYKIIIPDFSEISTHQLVDQFPSYTAPQGLKGVLHTDLHREYNKMFVNGKNGPIDGHWLCRI